MGAVSDVQNNPRGGKVGFHWTVCSFLINAEDIARIALVDLQNLAFAICGPSGGTMEVSTCTCALTRFG
jgi:hypothetical protein